MLARRLLCQSYAKLIEFFRNIVTSPEFCIKHRNSGKDFSRNRKIPFVAFRINPQKNS
jgi:hypothetical protein